MYFCCVKFIFVDILLYCNSKLYVLRFKNNVIYNRSNKDYFVYNVLVVYIFFENFGVFDV